MQPPPTSYVERDGVSIAYQVVGDGAFDLLFAPGFVSHLDLQWTDPGFARFLTRLASFSRLILFDKAGTGLSDPVPHILTLEERMADMVAVLDAAGSTRASVLGPSEGGPASALLAASLPDRVRSLVLYGSFPVHLHALTEPELAAYPPDEVAQMARTMAQIEDVLAHWGQGRAMDLFAPSLGGEVQRRFYATFERASASPRMARALIESLTTIDVRSVLGSISAPTLVLHRRGDRVIPPRAGRMFADGIPGARFVELSGDDHVFWLGDADPIIDEIERFLTGSVRASVPDRVLASILFTDIVGSTALAAEMGDSAWRRTLEHHDALVKTTVGAHGGRVVKHIGDGALSSFPGPAAAVRCGQELTAAAGDLGVELRAGVHTGECEVIGDDLGGLAVHIGARVGSLAAAGEVLVSSTVRELVVGSGMRFDDRGQHELKGVPGLWHVYALGHGSVDAPRTAPLDAAADHMRLSDRMAVSLARRAPRAMRLGARAVSATRPKAPTSSARDD